MREYGHPDCMIPLSLLIKQSRFKNIGENFVICMNAQIYDDITSQLW